MYEKVDVWKRVGDDLLIRFQCVKRLLDGMFAVQNADYIRKPPSQMTMQASDLQFAELMLDDDPTSRCDWFASLSDAISDHERQFADSPDP